MKVNNQLFDTRQNRNVKCIYLVYDKQPVGLVNMVKKAKAMFRSL